MLNSEVRYIIHTDITDRKKWHKLANIGADACKYAIFRGCRKAYYIAPHDPGDLYIYVTLPEKCSKGMLRAELEEVLNDLAMEVEA